jgi:hypothetical protein
MSNEEQRNLVARALLRREDAKKSLAASRSSNREFAELLRLVAEELHTTKSRCPDHYETLRLGLSGFPSPDKIRELIQESQDAEKELSDASLMTRELGYPSD